MSLDRAIAHGKEHRVPKRGRGRKHCPCAACAQRYSISTRRRRMASDIIDALREAIYFEAGLPTETKSRKVVSCRDLNGNIKVVGVDA